MRNPDKPNDMLEQAIAGLRSDQPSAEASKAAGDRVWQNLSAAVPAEMAEGTSIQGCQSVRALLGPYQRRELSAARALLVQDHLRECADCHKAAEAAVRPAVLPWKQELPRATSTHLKWLAIAAALVLALAGGYMLQDWLAVPAGARARVESIDGSLYRVGSTQEAQLQPGQELGEGEKLRTAAGSRARVRLRDGSLVEMNERAEFSVSARRSDTTVHLQRGDIIVQAAKRQTGHLYVDARDCRVAVTGTVFSVSSGLKGSRVSVIEGEVRVAQAGANSILHPGEQLSTSAILGVTSVKQEIAWSEDLDKHLALLAEFAHLQNKLSANVQTPGLRYQSHLLPLLPQSTVLFAGLPNYADALGQANQLFQQELQESAVLREWWQQQKSARTGVSFDKAIEEVQQFGRYLGDEIIFSVNGSGHYSSPLLLAEVKKSGLKDFIQQLIAERAAHERGLRVVDEQELMALQPRGHKDGVVILVRPDLMIAGADVALLQSLNTQLPAGGGFAATPFGQRLSQAYQNGAGILFGADLAHMEAEYSAGHAGHAGHMANAAGRRQAFDRSGFADLQYLVAERKDAGGQVLTNAELSFDGPRKGIASWLAAPAAIGGLDFVSANAGAVGAFVSKSPAKMLDDLVSMGDERAATHVNELESKLKIRLREDLAAVFGGEITVALDGPLLPTPAWKVVAEVNDPVRLQNTLEQLAADVNAQQKPGHSISIEQSVNGGLTYYTARLAAPERTVEFSYTFSDGYMIIAPTRALVMNAIQVHQSGNSLAKSSEFHALLPQDNFIGVSGIIYQNLGPVVGPVSQQLTASQLQSLKAIAADTKPSVVCFYGADSSIRVTSTSRFFGLDLNTLTLSTLLNVGRRE